MDGLTSESWIWWAVALVFGAPVLLVALSELVDWLEHRGSAFARPVRFLRNVVIPVGWLMLLLVAVVGDSREDRTVRIVATALGFCLMLLALSLVKAGLFASAERTSWRGRLPGIFIDLVRVFLIIIGTAILLSVVWGANVGGLVAALGVTSIVIGLALQNAVGNVVSGLLLLFEQPFAIGDWLSVGDATGKVREVNWRAVHLDLGHSVRVVPNGSLALAHFTNHSRPSLKYTESVRLSFANDEAPNAVKAMLNGVAASLPGRDLEADPSTSVLEYAEDTAVYVTSFTVLTYEQRGLARDEFLTRAWYAARRRGLVQAGAEAAPEEAAQALVAALESASPVLHLSESDRQELEPHARRERYAAGEVIQRAGEPPEGTRVVLSGRVVLSVESPASGPIALEELTRGDYFGQRVLTREPARSTATAAEDTELLLVAQDALSEVLARNSQLLQDFDEVRARRADAVRRALDPIPRRSAVTNGRPVSGPVQTP